jgi:hypothetical protein
MFTRVHENSPTRAEQAHVAAVQEQRGTPMLQIAAASCCTTFPDF